MRNAHKSRKTRETEVEVKIELDGNGESKLDTGITAFDHLLGALSRHGLFDLTIKAKDQKPIDGHHIVEDVGIVLGQAFKKALKEKKGIRRFGYSIIPMDDALSLVSVDISGRGIVELEISFSRYKMGDLTLDLIPHFFESFGLNSGINIHAKILSGRDDHHKAESLFKTLGIALRQAVEIDERQAEKIPSQKGTLD